MTNGKGETPPAYAYTGSTMKDTTSQPGMATPPSCSMMIVDNPQNDSTDRINAVARSGWKGNKDI